ncbi:MAG TPA: hypothetical protein PKC80_08970 [Burkholderiaceae bacterium]|nr:hypothetical protein [Burkholderiaceae bacterium]
MTLPVVKFAIVAFDDVRLTIDPFVAVKLVVLIVPDVRLTIDPVPTVSESPVSQVSAIVELGPPAVTKVLFDPTTEKQTVVFAAGAAANAFCTGKVMTKPELTNSIASVLLTLVLTTRCVVVTFVIHPPRNFLIFEFAYIRQSNSRIFGNRFYAT